MRSRRDPWRHCDYGHATRFWRRIKPFAALDFRNARGDFGARLAGLNGIPQSRLSGGYSVADHQVHDLTPEDVSKGWRRDAIFWSTSASRTRSRWKPIRVAWSFRSRPSTRRRFPIPQGKQVVFACRSGKRSVTASLAAQAAGLPYDKHLAGGILGWKAAGLQTKAGG